MYSTLGFMKWMCHLRLCKVFLVRGWTVLTRDLRRPYFFLPGMQNSAIILEKLVGHKPIVMRGYVPRLVYEYSLVCQLLVSKEG